MRRVGSYPFWAVMKLFTFDFVHATIRPLGNICDLVFFGTEVLVKAADSGLFIQLLHALSIFRLEYRKLHRIWITISICMSHRM